MNYLAITNANTQFKRLKWQHMFPRHDGKELATSNMPQYYHATALILATSSYY